MERLKGLREEYNLKQKDIAAILGIDRSTYSSYEIERDTMPITHLNKLCNYFHTSIDYILKLTSEKTYPHEKENIDKEKLTIRLKSLRKENHLTQEKVAEILNISRSTWADYERGKYQISTLFLYELAKKYNSSVDYLLGKIDEIPNKE